MDNLCTEQAEIDGEKQQRIAKRNRQNAQKSTGPRTPQGKKWSAQNSFKHGFFSRCVLLTHPSAGEDPEELDALRSAVYNEWQPVGIAETFWVDQIAAWSWRLRRLLRYETGVINRSIIEYEVDPLSKIDLAGALPQSGDAELIAKGVEHLLVPADSDRLIRYEITVSRHVEHAMEQLRSAQARRKARADSEDRMLPDREQ